MALPLDAINRAAQAESSNPFIKGHPKALKWWARRPLAACRAVLFATLVDDPSSNPRAFPSEFEQEKERQRLFAIIERLVDWESTNEGAVLAAARAEIDRSIGDANPVIIDPFCGGGSIPLEAQRLGLDVRASDLNPVAVLITTCLVRIPPLFAEHRPVNPTARNKLANNIAPRRAHGLAEDVRHYGDQMQSKLDERLRHLYPPAISPDGSDAIASAWVWARIAACPNPACTAEMPLVRSFTLSRNPRRACWVKPKIDGKAISFEVVRGRATVEGTIGAGGARCLVCDGHASYAYLREEGKAGRLGARLLAVVARGHNRQKVFLSPTDHQEAMARSLTRRDEPSSPLPAAALGLRVQAYGMTRHRDLFSPRQLESLHECVRALREIRAEILADAQAAGMSSDPTPLSEDGTGAGAYAHAVITYLALAVARLVMFNNGLCKWNVQNENVANPFGLQTLSMTWDYVESSPLDSAVSFANQARVVADVLERAVPAATDVAATTRQLDAAKASFGSGVVVTDPPYYDNVGYAALSDFFYVWLRECLRDVFPSEFATLLTPKDQELVADPARSTDGDRRGAERHFEQGMRAAFLRLRESQVRTAPLALFYAFKQTETDEAGAVSTGWQTMLDALLDAEFMVTGTWPVRTEREARSRSQGSNALASSIVLVCRPRPVDAPIATRREVVRSLRNELPISLRRLQNGNIAPVDLAQAAIGPGMAVFSRYAKVLEADGRPMTVRSALGLINEALDTILAEQEGDFEADTRFAVTWFEEAGLSEDDYGRADVLARAKDTSVAGMERAGILVSRGGHVRLLRRDELDDDWDPALDSRLTVWEVAQHLIKRLESGGEGAAAELLRRVGGLGEAARELAYRLYSTCEKKGWTQEALAYNALVVAWPEIARRVAGTPEAEAQQELDI